MEIFNIIYKVFWDKPNEMFGIELDEFLKNQEIFKKKSEKLNLSIEETKIRRHNFLKKMWWARKVAYENSRDQRKPFKERKEIANQMKMIQKIAHETKSAKLIPKDKWLCPDDIEEIEKLGLQEFCRKNFTRITYLL